MGISKVNYGTKTLIDLTADTVDAASLLSGVTAHGKSGEKITGSMTNRGAGGGTIAAKAGSVAIPAGYYNGSGSVSISATEQAKIIAENIRQGVTLLGVSGSLNGLTQYKSGTVTPSSRIAPTSSETSSSYKINVGFKPVFFYFRYTGYKSGGYAYSSSYQYMVDTITCTLTSGVFSNCVHYFTNFLMTDRTTNCSNGGAGFKLCSDGVSMYYFSNQSGYVIPPYTFKWEAWG